MSDFQAFSLSVARNNGIEGLLPVVEKELIHYEILEAMGKSKWLSRLNFQGGTCLRLCYGSVRYSEDLDFNTQEDLTETDLGGFKDIVSESLRSRFGVDVRVKDPKKIKQFEGGGTMKRWQVVVDTAPERPDLPSQKIKIEIAQVPSYTREIRLVTENYPEIQGMYGAFPVGCQSLGEILADKFVSFSQQEKTPRYRDLWDIPWILQQPGINLSAVADLTQRKVKDYASGKNAVSLLEDGRRRATECVQSGEFVSQMSRFLPPAIWARTANRPDYLEALSRKISEGYRDVLELISNEGNVSRN